MKIAWYRQITQHICYGLTPLLLGILLHSVTTSYMPGTFDKIASHHKSNHLRGHNA